MKKNLVTGLVLLLASPAWAQDAPLHLWHQGRHAEAIAAWQQRALAGDARAAVFLGHIHRGGLQIAADAQVALRWYLQAVEREFPEAQYELALMYEMGIGTGPDIGEATYWYGLAGTQACRTGKNTEDLLQYAR